jgi:hypothetical protein
MAKKIEIEVDVTGNIVESSKNLRALKQQLKELPAGTSEWSKIKNQIRDIEDSLESAGQASEDFKGLLENAPGPLGMLGGAIKKVELATKSWGAAFNAIGIGLLVSLIGGLVAAFSQTEGSLKKLEPLMIGLEKIFGGILEVIQPILDTFLDLALKALPYVTSGIGKLYSGFVAFFTLIKEAGTGVGKILKGIFTLDTDSITSGYEQIKGSLGKTVDAYNEGINRFEAGTKKLTKTQKENAKNSKEIADKALADRLKNMETNDKLDLSELEKQKQLALLEAFNDEQRLAVEQKFYEKSYELRKKDLLDKQKLYGEETNEYKELQTQLNTLDSERIAKTKEFKDKDKDIRDKNAKEITDFEIKLAADLQKIEDKKKEDKLKQDIIDKGNRDTKFQSDMLFYRNDLDMQRQLLEQKKIADEKYYKEQLAAAGLTAEAIQQLNEKKLADETNYINSSIQLEQSRVAIKQKALDDIISIAGAESDIGRIALVAKQILLAKELAMEVSRTITFGNVALANATVDITAGAAKTAKVGFPQNIPLLIGYAAQAVGIISAIKSAVSAAKGATSGASVGSAPATPNMGRNYEKGGLLNGPRHAQGGMMIEAEGGEAIMTRGAVTMFNPLLSMMNQMGGGVAFTKGATGQASYDSPKTSEIITQPQIIKTYVVSSDMTNEQQRQARLKDLSTL